MMNRGGERQKMTFSQEVQLPRPFPLQPLLSQSLSLERKTKNTKKGRRHKSNDPAEGLKEGLHINQKAILSGGNDYIHEYKYTLVHAVRRRIGTAQLITNRL